MNILNNILNAISTPNESLMVAANIILLFFELAITYSLISSVFNIKFTLKQKHIYLISTWIVNAFLTYFVPFPFNTIINYLFAFIILFFVMKLGLVKSLIATIFPSIIFSLISYLLVNPYLKILDITFEQASTTVLYRVPYSLSVYLIILFIILLIRYKNITVKVLDDFDKKNKFIITLNFIFGILYILFQGVILVNYLDSLPIQYSLLNVVCSIIYFALSFFTLNKITSLITTEKKLASAEEYNQTLRILHDNVRGFKHDFNNIVTTIGGYVNTDDLDGLRKYYKQLEEDCEKVNNMYLLNPDIINNPGVYNLLTTKYSDALNKHIKVNLTFLLDLKDLHTNIYEFARILGILLDNAIEAASECEEKAINIVFRDDQKNNRNIILVENTYKNKDVNIDNIFGKGVSGKENHTGLGLWEIREILKKSNNLNLYTSKTEKYFSQQLEIYYQ